jgi:hypothetical protein
VSGDGVPAPVEALVRAIAGGDDDADDVRATTFARGLALGALVGAAIAGSTIWQRRHARRSAPTMSRVPHAAAEAAEIDDARAAEKQPARG